jgi:hypothetical protein
MTLDRRAFLALALAAPVAACATRPADPTGPTVPITLVGAFSGRSVGAGVFRDITGTERRFTARLNGRLTGDRLTVVEDFRYDDGQEDRLTWVFDRAGPGRWTGRREDTVGEAVVVEDGRTIRLSYTADFRSLSGVTRLGFEDVIYALPDGRVVNDAVVTRLGVPVGRVRFELRR